MEPEAAVWRRARRDIPISGLAARLRVAKRLLRHPAAAGRGVVAAVRSARHVSGPRVERLLDRAGTESSSTPTAAGLSPDAAPPAEWKVAQQAAYMTLRRLARLPGRRWRETCLYRSVASCLLLEKYGVAAGLRVGVRRSADAGEEPLHAHAWVVVGGRAMTTPGSTGLAALGGRPAPRVLAEPHGTVSVRE